MKHSSYFFLPCLLVLLLACQNDDTPERFVDESFHINLSVGGVSFDELGTDQFEIQQGRSFGGCIAFSNRPGGLAYGLTFTSLVSKEGANTNGIKRVSFGILRKEESFTLNLADDNDYLDKVLQRRGEWVFTPDTETYVPDISSNELRQSEVYMEIETAAGEFYSSMLYEGQDYISGTFFRDDRVEDLGVFATNDYAHFITAGFKVNMAKSATDETVVVEGTFRLPVFAFPTRQVVDQCF